MAIYNNPYQPYSNPYQPYNPPVQNYQPQPDTSIIWVQGESGAKAYPVQNGQSVVLFDSESEHFFIKTADASGMPSIKIIDYTIRDMSQPIQQQPTQSTAYVTQKEFDELKQQVQQILGGRKDESTISTADDKRRNR